MNKWLLYLLNITFLVVGLSLTGCTIQKSNDHKTNATTIKYVALGDSYTYGEAIDKTKTFPRQLTNKLNKEGVPIELTAVLAKTGWTTEGLIEDYLPQLKEIKPQFTTILIGVNDWVQGVPNNEFEANLNVIVKTAQEVPENKIILITIPDFSYTPNGSQYSKGRDITAGIKGFNEIIKSVALNRGVEVVDIYVISEEMQTNPLLYAQDDLHPSEEQYRRWVEKLYPAALNLLVP